MILYPAIIYTFLVFLGSFMLISGSPNNITLLVPFLSTLVELLMITFLGIMWIKREWVYDHSD